MSNSIYGCLLGMSVGDSLGLPVEGLSKNRLKHFLPNELNHTFLFGKGMCSDDTEHAYLTALALLNAKNEPEVFQRLLAKYLRRWFLTLPAGIGMATLKSMLKLCLGFTKDSGVFSAGNGPAMRSPIIGVYYGNEIDKLKKFVKLSTIITHTDPKAYYGALVIAYTAYLSSLKQNITPDDYLEKIKKLIPEDRELIRVLERVTESVKYKESSDSFSEKIGLKSAVTGYMYHTVPMVIHVWLSFQDNYAEAVKQMILCGGDTDTTAAILGGIIGARVNSEGIPTEWQTNIMEWPMNLGKIHKLSDSLYTNSKAKIKPLPYLFLLARNLIFMLIVLTHGFRRLLPPY